MPLRHPRGAVGPALLAAGDPLPCTLAFASIGPSLSPPPICLTELQHSKARDKHIAEIQARYSEIQTRYRRDTGKI
jgi:hypothetical protein